MKPSAAPITQDGGRLSLSQAQLSPCASCATSPCCSFLPLESFRVTNLVELDHAMYYLNFDRIELGLAPDGTWTVVYHHPCRFLSPDDARCTIYHEPERPNVCVHYNPFKCWYKPALTGTTSPGYLQIDRARMDFILQHLGFNDNREIIDFPAYETLLAAFADIPFTPPADPGYKAVEDAAMQGWKQSLLTPQAAATREPSVPFADFRDPCAGCQAYCCKSLVFPQTVPTTAVHLDHYLFSLGFPGIELGVADGSWAVLVKTTCRHLQDNRCSIFGKPERPQVCTFYNAWSCSYKPVFGGPLPADYLRLRLEHYPWLLECFEIDREGKIVQMPSVAAIREHVEKRLRAAHDAHSP